MPEISRFFGTVIAMYYHDHPPAYFHVRYGEQKAIVGIESLSVIEGELSRRVLNLVAEWGRRASNRADGQLGTSEAAIAAPQNTAVGVETMLQDIVDVRPVGGFNIRLKFEDGVEGTIDVSRLVSFHGVFAALEDPREFAKVRINRELGSIEWPNGADLDPDVLYQHVVEQAVSRGGVKSSG